MARESAGTAMAPWRDVLDSKVMRRVIVYIPQDVPGQEPLTN